MATGVIEPEQTDHSRLTVEIDGIVRQACNHSEGATSPNWSSRLHIPRMTVEERR
jgi:hypothetical protein